MSTFDKVKDIVLDKLGAEENKITEGTSFMFSVRENNWLGKGVHLTSALSLSEERVSGNIAVTDKHSNFGLSITLGVKIGGLF